MRLKISLYAERLPILYRHRIIAMIRAALELADPDLKESLYGGDRTVAKPKKPFTFNLALPRRYSTVTGAIEIEPGVVVEDRIFVIPPGENLSLYVSSPDRRFVDALYSGIFMLRDYRLDSTTKLTVKGVAALQDRFIETHKARFKVCSPICLYSRDGDALLPTSPDELVRFNEHFNTIHDRILRTVRGVGLHEPLLVTPVDVKKKIVKHAIRAFRQETGRPYMCLTSFTGVIDVTGHPEDLQALYDMGIGSRTGQGFGMVELD